MLIDGFDLPNFERVVNEYAREFEAVYKSNLLKGDWKASGKLIDSVHTFITVNGKTATVQMSLLDYWKYTEVGRGPTKKGGNGALRLNILQWIKDKGLQPNDNSNLPREKKLERMSYAITRKIHNLGWTKQATDKPYATTLDELNSKYLPLFEDALKQDTEQIVAIIWNNIFQKQ